MPCRCLRLHGLNWHAFVHCLTWAILNENPGLKLERLFFKDYAFLRSAPRYPPRGLSYRLMARREKKTYSFFSKSSSRTEAV